LASWSQKINDAMTGFCAPAAHNTFCNRYNALPGRAKLGESSQSWPNGKQKSQLGRTLMA
jgi:hypothetical protein